MSNKNKINHSPSGGLLQVVSTLPRYSYHLQAVPVASQQQIYEDEQIIFAQGLRKDILKKLTVRLSVADWGWEQAERWKESFDYICLESANKSMYRSINENRLFIGTYNATTILEALASNCPTILFWNPKYWELNASALKDYERLKRSGILFDTPMEAADQVNKVWDNIDQWWLEGDRQEVIKIFCSKYAKTEKNWLYSWRNEIRSL